ncbi:hypothetical protein BaRGS_00006867 [Batillaria attramentaria]|uniref:Uncharacterized protein n=1 Tax=Batillaria attramentaria TaxID=370345 RepID=A0ABD0LRI0_9CAEN
MEFAIYRLADLLPYVKAAKVIVLDPNTLVLGNIGDLYNATLNPDDWAAMPDLCSGERPPGFPQIWYQKYMNFSREEILDQELPPGACAPAMGVILANLTHFRLNRVRRQLWQWTLINERWPLFLKGVEGVSDTLGPVTVVFHNQTTQLSPRWYARVNDESMPAAGESRPMVYHWVGSGSPLEGKSDVAKLWRHYFVPDPWGEHKLQ